MAREPMPRGPAMTAAAETLQEDHSGTEGWTYGLREDRYTKPKNMVRPPAKRIQTRPPPPDGTRFFGLGPVPMQDVGPPPDPTPNFYFHQLPQEEPVSNMPSPSSSSSSSSSKRTLQERPCVVDPRRPGTSVMVGLSGTFSGERVDQAEEHSKEDTGRSERIAWWTKVATGIAAGSMIGCATVVSVGRKKKHADLLRELTD